MNLSLGIDIGSSSTKAAALDEPEESQSALPTARTEAAQPPDDDANPNTGL